MNRLLIIFALASQSFGVIAFTQSATNSTAFSGTTKALAFASNNTLNCLIVVTLETDDQSASPTISDSQTNTYTKDLSTSNSTSWQDVIWHAEGCKAGANTVTIGAMINGDGGRMAIHEYSGIATASATDQKVGANGNSTALSSGNVTTTTANELLFGFGFSLGATMSHGASYTSRISSDANMLTEDQIVSSMGTYAATETAASGLWTMQIVTFKGAAAGAPANQTPQVY